MTTFFNAAVNENGRFKSTNQQITNLMGCYIGDNFVKVTSQMVHGSRAEVGLVARTKALMNLPSIS